jgi:cobalt-zinc-cadmium efflux system outer membrane protein
MQGLRARFSATLACLCLLTGACATPLLQEGRSPSSGDTKFRQWFFGTAPPAGGNANSGTNSGTNSGDWGTSDQSRVVAAGAVLPEASPPPSAITPQPIDPNASAPLGLPREELPGVRSPSGERLQRIPLGVEAPGGVRLAASTTTTPGVPPEPAPDQGMTVNEALQHTLENHPLLRTRQHEVEIARAKLITAGLLPNPSLVLDVDNSHSSTDTLGAMQGGSDVSLSGRLVFQIPTAGKLRVGKRTAEAGIQRAQCALSAQTEITLLGAAQAALDVLYLQELALLHGELSALAAKGAEIENARFELKAIPFSDKIIAETNAAAAEMRRLDAQARLATARMRLARAIGMDPPRPVSMSGQLLAAPVPDVPLERIVAEAAQTRPELAGARAAVNEAQWQLELARAKAVPDVGMGPRFATRRGHETDEVGVPSQNDQNSVGARFQVDLPIFNRNQGGIAESASQLRANGARLDFTRLTTLNDVAAAYVELMSLRSHLNYYESQVVPLATQTEAMILEAYKDRAIDPVQVSDLQQKFAQMRLNYLDLRYRYNQLLLQLEIFLGRRMAGGGDRR